MNMEPLFEKPSMTEEISDRALTLMVRKMAWGRYSAGRTEVKHLAALSGGDLIKALQFVGYVSNPFWWG
jgi:hypothetical protein